jgi:hypothetical protein
MAKALTKGALIRAIQKNCTPELRRDDWAKRCKPGDHRLKGLCAVATQAFHHLMGGKAAGYKMRAADNYEDGSGRVIYIPPLKNAEPDRHWWAQGPSNDGVRGAGAIEDLTAAQFPGKNFVYNYARGKGAHPMGKKEGQLTERAEIVVERVTALFGRAALKTFRDQQIASFELLQDSAKTPPRRAP